MEIVPFRKEHIKEAEELALLNYEEERKYVPALPTLGEAPSLLEFAENGLGVAAVEGGRLMGYLCGLSPWENAFGTTDARGTFSPIHAHGDAHGAREWGRGRLYQRMYQQAAGLWAARGITSHSIGLYAHDRETIQAMFAYGFGWRCADAVRRMEGLKERETGTGSLVYRELSLDERTAVRDLQRKLWEHLGNSPCFMGNSREQIEDKIRKQEQELTRVFAAMQEKEPVAFLEISSEGENFAANSSDMQNICGAYCLPAYRGKAVMQGLLNRLIQTLKAEGYTSLGVDYESFNPAAAHFWPKYFAVYTCGLVRRIDEAGMRSYLQQIKE